LRAFLCRRSYLTSTVIALFMPNIVKRTVRGLKSEGIHSAHGAGQPPGLERLRPGGNLDLPAFSGLRYGHCPCKKIYCSIPRCNEQLCVDPARMVEVKKLITILIVLVVSFSSAQENARKDGTCVGLKRGVTDNGLTFADGEWARGSESMMLDLSERKQPRQLRPRTLFSSFRQEMKSLASTLPDVAVSWFGLSCYVRNPLKYKLSPGSTYDHQVGLATGDWSLSVDGIKPTTLADMHLALQYPVSASMNLFFRYRDTHYMVDLQALGKLPWED